jgi:hypothetical protein
MHGQNLFLCVLIFCFGACGGGGGRIRLVVTVNSAECEVLHVA